MKNNLMELAVPSNTLPNPACLCVAYVKVVESKRNKYETVYVFFQ